MRYSVPEEDPRFGKIFDCDCRKAQIDADRLRIMRRLGGLDALVDKTFESFNPDGVGLTPGHQASLRYAYDRARAFAERPLGWLVIRGGYGCGKTHLAAAIANARLEQGEKAVLVTVPDLLDYLRAPFSADFNEEGETYHTRFDEVRTTPLLILDDLGIESPTAWAQEKLYQILNHRYNAQLPTVITTNHSMDEIELRLRSRLQDQDLTEVIVITAPDYRRAGVAANQSDLNTLGLYSHMTFESFKQRRELNEEMRENLKRALSITREYAARPEGWLILIGGFSSGKTHLAAAIANERARQGAAVLFITVPDLLDHLRATYAPNSSASYDKRFNEVKNADLLVLDDLGTESATPWAREKLYQLFNYRFNARLPTVITTSRELDDLDPRLVTRMRDKRLCRLFALLAPAYLGERSG